MVALHNDTAANAPDTTMISLVIGLASQTFGGGYGSALRLERQITARTAVGAELLGGFGDSEHPAGKRWLFGLRGYGRFSARDQAAFTYGAGLSVMDLGLVTLTLHGGVAVSYPNDRFVPYFGSGLAAAIPLRKGEPFGSSRRDTCFPCAAGHPADDRAPIRTHLFLYTDLGFVVPVGDTGNRISADAGVLVALIGQEGLVALSIADAQRLDR